VRINVLADSKFTEQETLRNIYCINDKYEILWQVTEVGSKPIDEFDAFIYIDKNARGELLASRFSGFQYQIDSDTGEAKQISFHK
jgi:hypothetical protein